MNTSLRGHREGVGSPCQKRIFLEILVDRTAESYRENVSTTKSNSMTSPIQYDRE